MDALKYVSKLQNQRVLVLGGTSGIGFCVAEAALEYGAHVIVSGSNEAKLARTLTRLRESPGGRINDGHARIGGKTCDLASTDTLESNLKHLLDYATDNGSKKLDHVVFTAGDAIIPVPLAQITPDVISRAAAVRSVAPVILAKLLPGYIRMTSSSSLTLTGGTNTDKPMPGWAVVAGVGATIEGLARGFAVDLKPLRVNTVSPGAVHTELFDSIPEAGRAGLIESMRAATLTGTIGRPEDVAEAYVYCMRDHFVDGVVIQTNGGRILA